MYECKDIHHYKAKITLANGEQFYFGDSYHYTQQRFDRWIDRIIDLNSTIQTNDERLIQVKYIVSIEYIKTNTIKDFHYINSDRFGMIYFPSEFIINQTNNYSRLKSKLSKPNK